MTDDSIRATSPLRVTVAALALSAVLLIPAIGQPVHAQTELPGVFSEIIDVRVVNLDVVVVDKDGNRVSGLTPEDFRLTVDGEEVPIDYFTEVLGGRAVALTEEDRVKGVQGLPAVDPGAEVGTSYLVFVDDFFTIARDRDRVLDELSRQSGLIGPNDRMAIVAYDGKTLDMITVWTQNSIEIEKAIRRAMARPAYGLQRRAELRTLSAGFSPVDGRNAVLTGSAGPTGLREILRADERDYALRLSGQIEGVTMAAAATLRSFASPPGRKVMMLLSGGWPLDPVSFTINQTSTLVREAGLPKGEDLMRTLTDTANRLGYTLYPIDVPGVLSNFGGAEAASPRNGLANFDLREYEGHAMLSQLAERTGGKAMLNSRRDRALENVSDDTRSYYWMGFTPERREDDRRHRIEVEVLGPGLKVRSRQNFVDLSREAEVTMMVESALLFGNAPSPYPLPIEVGDPEKAGRRKVRLPVKMAIPVDGITLLPIGERWSAQVELRIASLDETGQRSDVPVIPITISSAETPQEGTHVLFETEVLLRKAKQTVVVSVYDPPSGQVLSTRLDLDL